MAEVNDVAMTARAPDRPQPDPAGAGRHSWTLVIISCAQLMVILDSTIMIVALPSAQHSLGFSNSDRQWVITAYSLTFGGLLLLGGRIGDMVGARRTLITGVVGFAAASAIGGASQSFGMLVFARGLQGLFGALLAPSVLSLLNSTFTEQRERARAFGVYASIAIGGAVLGLILGGLLTEYLDWRWCLYVNVPIAAIVAVGAAAVIPRRSGHPGVRLDIPGAVLGCGGLVALVYALGEAATDGWASTQVIGGFAASAVLLTAFVVVQSKVANPLLPLRILANRNRAGAFLGLLFAVIAVNGVLLFLTYFLQTINRYTPAVTGLAFAPMMIMNGLAATQISSRLLPRVPTRLLIIPGLTLAAAGTALLTRLTPGAGYAGYLLPAEMVLGFGLGLSMVPFISTATNNADPRDIGVTSAATNTTTQIGASIGTALINTVAATATATYLVAHAGTADVAARATVHGYTVASGWATVFLLLAAVLAGSLINARPARLSTERRAESTSFPAEARQG
jgi:EmrB/QacA subfamily drug resistance transporter